MCLCVCVDSHKVAGVVAADARRLEFLNKNANDVHEDKEVDLQEKRTRRENNILPDPAGLIMLT